MSRCEYGLVACVINSIFRSRGICAKLVVVVEDVVVEVVVAESTEE